MMPMIAEVIDGMLESAQEVYGSMPHARLRPHVLMTTRLLG